MGKHALDVQAYQAGQWSHGDVNIWSIVRDEGEII